MLDQSIVALEGSRLLMNEAYRQNEKAAVSNLLKNAILSPAELQKAEMLAKQLVEHVRHQRKKTTGIDSFLIEYALSTEEGIALMCLAEPFLRVPDKATRNNLIKDKLAQPNWAAHRGQSDSLFVNAATWGLMLTGRVLDTERSSFFLPQALKSLVSRSSEGVIRKAVEKAMRIMSKQFITGRTIEEALSLSKKKEALGYRFSFDMLGEAALTREDALRYFNAYMDAIHAIGASLKGKGSVYTHPGISIKLSALHPRYQLAQWERVMGELAPKLLLLAQAAKQYDIALTIDAEESERLDLSLDIIERVFNDDSLNGWDGFGMAVQSYQKRAFYLIDWVAALARQKNRRMMVRLIKGAYWDSEIKKTQMQGLSDYPVFTRKVFTDVSFQACARKILTMTDAIYPQFATHNAYSVAMILSIVGDYRDFEFQCLHGMGSELYEQIVPADCHGIPCRVYAPVGTHEDLLPYLVRRLLENGANSSFVNQIVDEKQSIASLIENPVSKAQALLDKGAAPIPLPQDIFAPRKNSAGLDLSDKAVIFGLKTYYETHQVGPFEARPLLGGVASLGSITEPVFSPIEKDLLLGRVTHASPEDIDTAFKMSLEVFPVWSEKPVRERAECLLRLSSLLEAHKETLLFLLCKEAGKTWSDGVGEIREAVDFCRYYADMAIKLLENPTILQGYTGETNRLSLHPRGTIVCISPWNFPLAIFTGQIVAALVTGNCVLAKPAEQTPLIAALTVQLMVEAGIPQAAIQLLPGTGEAVGARLVSDHRVKAVIFTGSTQTASLINQVLANKGGEIVPLIAETGGQNTMIVDSSALLEQVINDVMVSAFGSAGQRCSALRVVYVQEDVYPRFISLLKGAMAELCIGDPTLLKTDIGPVIDEEAQKVLNEHIERMRAKHPIIFQASLPPSCEKGYFVAPTAIAIDSIKVLDKEIFGPVLHVVSFKWKQLDHILADINEIGYGLTLGIHTRLNERAAYIRDKVRVGNCYVNRNMIGAVVGLQPFGGEGLSGTGPKAGGPHYLLRLCQERTYTVDTTAAGGNATLMVQEGL